MPYNYLIDSSLRVGLNLSLEQIQKVRTDFKYANTKIAKYINKSRNHPHLDILQALAS
jgi:hypothetical protein